VPSVRAEGHYENSNRRNYSPEERKLVRVLYRRRSRTLLPEPVWISGGSERPARRVGSLRLHRPIDDLPEPIDVDDYDSDDNYNNFSVARLVTSPFSNIKPYGKVIVQGR
jgi:hypothetical protein